MADVTITIQAASDAIMTVNNSYGGTALSDSDPRKCFGLPQMYIDYKHSQHFSAGPRWDTVNSMTADGGRRKQGSDVNTTYMNADYKSSINANYMKPPPTTTAFQLKCERISHDVMDMTRVSPMPMFSVADGSHAGVTPGQLNNIVIALGMRKEVIKLSGTLVDRGPVTAANPRRQTLLNIARTQYLKISRGGMFKDNDELNTGWGGAMASPLNPRAYPCLTIFDSLITPGFSIGREPSNDRRSYRGLIKTLSFTLDGGRDDLWKFDMTFEVMSNEHVHSNPVGRPEWEGRINRVEAVTSRVEKGVTINASAGHSFLKIHSSRALRIKRKGVDGENIYQNMIGEELAPPDMSDSTWSPNDREYSRQIAQRKLGQGSIIYIEGSNSTPNINGFWHVRAVDLDNDTFIVGHPGSTNNLFGEKDIWQHAYNANRQDTNDPDFITDTALEWDHTNNRLVEVGPDEDTSAEGRIYWGAQKGLFY